MDGEIIGGESADEEIALLASETSIYWTNHRVIDTNEYGVKDHYHENNATGTNTTCKNAAYGCSECGNEKRSKNCIMYTSDRPLTSEPLLCDDCQHDLLTHLVAHH